MPSSTCYVHVWTTHDEYSVVFITVHNLVRIDAVVSITCECWYSTRLACKCLFTLPMEVFEGIIPHKGAQEEQSHCDPQKHLVVLKHVIRRIDHWSTRFCTPHPFTQVRYLPINVIIIIRPVIDLRTRLSPWRAQYETSVKYFRQSSSGHCSCPATATTHGIHGIRTCVCSSLSVTVLSANAFSVSAPAVSKRHYHRNISDSHKNKWLNLT